VLLINQLLAQGLTILLSPISLGDDGNSYNVNADDAASALAKALHAELVTFVSNVPGVLENGRLLPTLTPMQTERLINQQIITDGMIPKVRAATKMIADGVAQARITNLAGLENGTGTIFSRQQMAEGIYSVY
jgi:acetylglutamate kinase